MYVRSCPPLWVITRCSEGSHEGAALAHTRTLVLRCIGHHQHAPPRKHPVHGSKDASRTPTTSKDASAAQLRISTRHAGPRRRERTSRPEAPTWGRPSKRKVSETRHRHRNSRRKRPGQAPARAAAARRVERATEPEPSVYARRFARPRRRALNASRRPGRDLADKIEFRPLRHITCAWGSGDRVHEGGAPPTRRGMSPPAGSTAPRLLVEATRRPRPRPQHSSPRAV